MRRPPASRRRIRPTLAAAVGCGVLGGSLVGLGAMGFDKAPASAAACIDAPPEPAPMVEPDPSPDADPEADGPDPDAGPDEDLVVGEPVTDSPGSMLTAANEAALAETPVAQPVSDVPSSQEMAKGPLGHDTTIAPGIGARKPVCEPDPVVIPLPGPDDPDDDPIAEPDDDPIAEPTPEPELEAPDDDPAPTPVVTPVVTPRPTPIPTPRPVVNPPLVSPNPVLPTPSTTTRGFSTSSRPRTPTPGRTGTITRAEVIARAVSWVTQRVPYSQVRWWNDLNGVYRQDCSGYVSMAWRTDQRINYWTGNLGTISDRIPSSSLQPGDILLLPGKHTVIFAGWANVQRTKFHLFEEYRTGTPARFLRNASLSYYLDRGYGAYEYDGIRGTVANSVPLPVANPAPTPVPIPQDDPAPMTAQRERQDTVALLSAQSGSGTTTAPIQQTWTIEQALADLPATDWSPGVAEDYTPESAELALAAADVDDPIGAPQISVEDLVEAQTAVDQAEEQRLAAVSRDALLVSENRTSGAGVLLAAGLGLLFVAIPLGAASRRAWTAASASVPVPVPVPPERGLL